MAEKAGAAVKAAGAVKTAGAVEAAGVTCPRDSIHGAEVAVGGGGCADDAASLKATSASSTRPRSA